MRKKQRQLLTQEEEEKQRLKSCIFCFIILIVAISGYMYEGVFTYHPDKSLVPNFLDYVYKTNYIDDTNTYGDYHTPIPVTKYDIKPNMVWTGWMLMIMLFTPLFIILLTGVKTEKITKEKISIHLNMIKKYYEEEKKLF